MEATAAFPYAHGYGQSEVLMSSIHEGRNGGDERDANKEHHRSGLSVEHGHIPSTMSHPAAALLDHAFLQQALESRGGDIGGREALHAMALAAAAHAAVNRISASPGPNGNLSGTRSPSPGTYASLKYATPLRNNEQETQHLPEHHKELCIVDSDRQEMQYEEHERDADDEDDQVEDLSVQRHSGTKSPVKRSDSPYIAGSGVIKSTNALSESMHSTTHPATKSHRAHSVEDFMHDNDMKRELVIDENRVD